MTSFLLMSLAPSYFLAKLTAGRIQRTQGHYKLLYPVAMCIYTFMVGSLTHLPLGRRLYTELLTDTTNDGNTLRDTLRLKNPNLWCNIS